jgi:cytoskeletal protein CcmA (bactofilin family)
MIKEGIPLSTTPLRSAEIEVPRGSASIGKSVTIKGQIFSREDLFVDGEINGTLEAHEHRITIGPNGKVEAGVKAREIVILGTVHGNVEASDKIDLRKEARLVGDIKTSRIIIEDGAFFKGSIDIVRPETPKPTAPPRPAATAPAPAVSAPAPEAKR